MSRARAANPDRPAGPRVYWIDGRDYYPITEAAAMIATAGPRMQMLLLRRVWKPKDLGGEGLPCQFLGRAIGCRLLHPKTRPLPRPGVGIRSDDEYSRRIVYDGDDLRVIEAAQNGWAAPRPRPAPAPAGGTSDELQLPLVRVASHAPQAAAELAGAIGARLGEPTRKKRSGRTPGPGVRDLVERFEGARAATGIKLESFALEEGIAVEHLRRATRAMAKRRQRQRERSV